MSYIVILMSFTAMFPSIGYGLFFTFKAVKFRPLKISSETIRNRMGWVGFGFLWSLDYYFLHWKMTRGQD
jgi:hypothetical protein